MENKNLLPLTPVLLPTEDASELWFISMPNNPNWLHLHPRNVKARVPNQHLYLTSDREIKEGDWIERLGKAYKINKFSSDREYRRAECSDGLVCDASKEDWGNKIEFTTAPQLISDGVYEIPENIWMLHSLPLFDKSEHNSYLQINLLEEFVKRYNNRNVKGVDVKKIFAENFEKNMRENNVAGFKRAYPTLYNRVIIPSMNQALQSNAGGFSLEDMRKCFEKGFSYENFGVPDNREGYFNEFIQSLTPKQGNIEMWCEMEEKLEQDNSGGCKGARWKGRYKIKLINGSPIIMFK